MLMLIFPLYNFCQVSKIRIPWYIERNRELVPHHHFLALPALKASPLKFLPHGSEGDVNLTIIYLFQMDLLHQKMLKKGSKRRLQPKRVKIIII